MPGPCKRSGWIANDPRVAIAALGARANISGEQARPAYVMRTMNGGIFWDDITSNLPDNAAAHGVTADRISGAIYVATDAGVFFTVTDLAAAGSATAWTSLAQNLPTAAATDVKLDAGRQSNLCGAGRIRSVRRDRSASFARCAGGQRRGFNLAAGRSRCAAQRSWRARAIGQQRRHGRSRSGRIGGVLSDPSAIRGQRR